MILKIIIIFVLIAVIAIIVNAVEDNKDDKVTISFRESLDLSGLPVVTFRQGNTKLNFILDTGSNVSVIDGTIVKKLKVQETERKTNITGIGGTSGTLNVVDINFKYKGVELSDSFQVVDMSDTLSAIKATTGVTAHGLIGNEFMQKYEYILDFENMVAIMKK